MKTFFYLAATGVGMLFILTVLVSFFSAVVS